MFKMFIFKVLKTKTNILNITFQIKNTKKKSNNKIKVIKHSVSADNIQSIQD